MVRAGTTERMGLRSNNQVVLVDSTGHGSDVEIYSDRLSLVLKLIGCGSISCNGVSMFGSEEHVAALDAIERRVAEVRGFIAEEEAGE